MSEEDTLPSGTESAVGRGARLEDALLDCLLTPTHLWPAHGKAGWWTWKLRLGLSLLKAPPGSHRGSHYDKPYLPPYLPCFHTSWQHQHCLLATGFGGAAAPSMLSVGCMCSTLPQRWYQALGSSRQGHAGLSSQLVSPSRCFCPDARVRLSDPVPCFPKRVCISVSVRPTLCVSLHLSCVHLQEGVTDLYLPENGDPSLARYPPPPPPRVSFWVCEGGSRLGFSAF